MCGVYAALRPGEEGEGMTKIDLALLLMTPMVWLAISYAVYRFSGRAADDACMLIGLIATLFLAGVWVLVR